MDAEQKQDEQARFYDPAEYKRIYSIKDRFERERALADFAREGRAVGVIGIKKMYADYVAENKHGRLYASNVTAFDGQQLELSCGEWKADDMGITKTGSFGEEIVACVHPIMPVMRLVNIDSGTEKMMLAFRRGKTWQVTVVPKSEIASANKIIDLADAGIAVTSENARHLVAFLHDVEAANYDEIPSVKSVTRLGHIGGEFFPYSSNVVFDGDASYRQLFSAIKSAGTLEAWTECMRTLRRESVAAKIVLAASFASVLIEPLGLLPFFVHLWGSTSGTGKTVGLMAAASVWGDPAIGKYIQTFHSTAVGHERLAAFLNSLPVIIDELQLADVDGAGDKAFNVYRLAEGVGKSRGNRRGGVDATPTWANTILTSGETPIIGDRAASGARNRVIEIECGLGTYVVRNGHDVAAIVKQNHGTAGRYFIEHLDLDKAREMYQARFRYFTEQATDKQAMAAACLMVADALATELIFKDGQQLTAGELEVFLQTSAEVDANERAWSFIRDWVSQNSAAFSAEKGARDCFGVFDSPNLDDEIERVFIIKSVFRDVLTRAGFSYKSFQAWLVSQGLLRMQAKNYTVVKHIHGIRTDVYDLKLQRPVPVQKEEQTVLPF